jgi:ESCRT-I complex subunit TSG101
MYLKENHPHVGSDGMVYMPYTHEWNPHTHSLIEMVVAMSSVFSAEPPVFTRSALAPPPPVAAVAAAAAPPPPAYRDASFVSPATTTTQNAESERYMREQMEAIMVMEESEAAEAARKAAKDEEECEKQIAAQKLWEEKKKTQIKEQVNQKIQAHLVSVAAETKSSVQSDWRDQQLLKKAKETVSEQLRFLQETKQQLEAHIVTVDTKTGEIQKWLEESKESSSSQTAETSVDDSCQPLSKLHAQILDLSAENAALTDALYFLDRGMYVGGMDCTTHLKSVRKLAKRQFLVRAHLMKVNQVLLKNNNHR